MAVIETIHSMDDSSIYFWKITEDSNYFLDRMSWDDKQLIWLNSIHPQKKLEYMASRYLIYKITGKLDAHLYKDESGKLHFQEEGEYLSISHSGEYVALIVSKRPAGIDVQRYQDKIIRIADRFLHPNENAWLHSIDAWNIPTLCTCWCIKEAVYKANGQKGIHFAQQILLHFEPGLEGAFKINKAQLKGNQFTKTYQIQFGRTEDYCWAFALELTQSYRYSQI